MTGPAPVSNGPIYHPRGAALELLYYRGPEVLIEGPADTGKSRASLEKLYICAKKYAGMRALVIRKTRKSVTQSSMVTFEKKVLPPGSLVHFHTGKQAYLFPEEGSEIVIGGLDDPIKVQSSEYDMIYIPEATEVSENDCEMVSKLLRNGVMPYQQLLMDCNPGAPAHWLNKRCSAGKTHRLRARHSDNPSITEERLERLRRLSGVRRKRLYEGIWAAAEGMIYDNWDPDFHVIKRFDIPATWRRVAGVDWGYTKPGVIQIWAIDGDGRAYLVHEIYRVQKKINWWVEQAQRLIEVYNPDTFYCDPSEPAYIADFTDAGIPAVGANNDVGPGIQTVQQQLDKADDGRARLYVFEDALEERDLTREEEKQPCGLIEEREGYVWKVTRDGTTKDEPAECEDHAEDSCRYALHSIAPKGPQLPASTQSHTPKNLYA